MNILLTGAGGQLGSEWKDFLSAVKTNHFRACTSRELDITDPKKVKEVLDTAQPDLLINCAAYTQVDRAEDEPDKAHMVNAQAVSGLARQCALRDVKLVHFSTDYVFSGREEDRKRLPAGYPEDHPADPINIYGQTKWEGEEAIRHSGCRHLVIRVSWLCGRYGNNFVKTMLRLAEERSSLDVVDDQWGSPTFTDSTVKSTWSLIEEECKGTYHLTSDGLITWADFAGEIFRLSGKQVEINRVDSEHFPVKARRPHFSKLDTTKIKQVPGVKPEDWKVGLERLIRKL